MLLNWNFRSYDDFLDYLEEQLSSHPTGTSRSRDLAYMRDKLLPAMQRWKIPLALVNSTGLSKLRQILPEARKALRVGDESRLRHVLELASRLSWRDLRRELGTVRRVHVTAQVWESSLVKGIRQTHVAFTVTPRVWSMLLRLTRDHIDWTQEIR